MKSIREMNDEEYRLYLKTRYQFSDELLDGKVEICFYDLFKLLDLHSEMGKELNRRSD